ncbi:carbohydrate ABC transporter permease [Egibacter rhizosphaerae]|uniref:Carbohydrate ABC transporter permease n=1 Tax=Egibacter rhizosphaerae TaxID=1670831 RepID=A0A411YC81_9ACTN|nr:carbohydrate ABC transporter permease [Egibacter rhizosphaerae]QBI18757.1 carbohydrate ABC transporter permease [Egibacter rhizosphaerae]
MSDTFVTPDRARRIARWERTATRLEVLAAWLIALLWLAPLAYIFWAAFRETEVALSFQPFTGWTFDNLVTVWNTAPFDRFYFNTTVLVIGLSAGQIILGSLAAYAFARYRFPLHNFMFTLVLLQLMIFPEVLLGENFRLVANLGLADTLAGIGLPYLASAFFIFLLRQSFKSVPLELVEAAEVEGASRLEILWKVYVPVARPTIIAFGLVSVSFHWNNFLWPLVITQSVESRPITVGIYRFLSPEIGINFTALTAGTVITVLPLLALFLVAQRAFIQNFLRSGIK